jgi:hypothetical protein
MRSAPRRKRCASRDSSRSRSMSRRSWATPGLDLQRRAGVGAFAESAATVKAKARALIARERAATPNAGV